MKKKKVPFKKRFSYWFDQRMSKGSLGLIRLLAILTLVVILLVALVIFRIAPDEEGGFLSSLWESLSTVINAWMPSYWDRNGDPFASGGRLFFSFHGIPKECVEVKGDRYQAECIECASRIASALGLREGTWETTFQSRFGPHEWLQPYTQVRAEEAGKAGVPRLDIVTPGFSCDCLETLEEIGMEVRDGFLAGNPKGEFHHIPCLNSAPRALGFYEELIRKETSGWLE